jgi:hypothetical protein
MDDGLKRMYCERAVVVYFDVLSRHSPEETEKNNEKRSYQES